MIEILLLAIGWLLVGIGIAWVLGAVSGRETVTPSSRDRYGLVLLHGGNYHNANTDRQPRGARAGAGPLGKLQRVVTAARQSGCNEFPDPVLSGPDLRKRFERCPRCRG